MINKTTVCKLALSDIANYTIITNHKERYKITARDLRTKETRRLNRMLGLHKINK